MNPFLYQLDSCQKLLKPQESNKKTYFIFFAYGLNGTGPDVNASSTTSEKLNAGL